MNERIRHLSRSAIGRVLNGPDPDRDIDRMYIPDAYVEAFAKMIRQECCNAIMSEDKDGKFQQIIIKHFKE